MGKMANETTKVMLPKLVRIGNSCYRRLDCDPDGQIDDYSTRLGLDFKQQLQPSETNPKGKKFNPIIAGFNLQSLRSKKLLY